MRMIDLGSQTLQIMDTATAVECGGGPGLGVRLRRMLVACMLPACCGFLHHPPPHQTYHHEADSSSSSSPQGQGQGDIHHQRRVVTGTFFGRRKGGRVSFCVQQDSRSSPMLALELAVPTAFLAREMQCGVLRIALECQQQQKQKQKQKQQQQQRCSLLQEPVWRLFCNGRRVGYALRRSNQVAGWEGWVLKQMRSVSVGAGVLPEEDVLYMRAGFERVVGSADSESFHMQTLDSSSAAQHLSIFLLRS